MVSFVNINALNPERRVQIPRDTILRNNKLYTIVACLPDGHHQFFPTQKCVLFSLWEVQSTASLLKVNWLVTSLTKSGTMSYLIVQEHWQFLLHLPWDSCSWKSKLQQSLMIPRPPYCEKAQATRSDCTDPQRSQPNLYHLSHPSPESRPV